MITDIIRDGCKMIWYVLMAPFFIFLLLCGDTRSEKHREYDRYQRQHRWDTPNDDWRYMW